MKNNVILSVLLISMLLLNSCSTRYLSSIYAPLDTTVDYANTSNWAVHPDNIPEQLNFISLDESTLAVDVFFVHPTILTSKKDGTCDDETKNILGKAVIVHQGADDFVSQPSGAAGSRISCAGIIN